MQDINLLHQLQVWLVEFSCLQVLNHDLEEEELDLLDLCQDGLQDDLLHSSVDFWNIWYSIILELQPLLLTLNTLFHEDLPWTSFLDQTLDDVELLQRALDRNI